MIWTPGRGSFLTNRHSASADCFAQELSGKPVPAFPDRALESAGLFGQAFSL